LRGNPQKGRAILEQILGTDALYEVLQKTTAEFERQMGVARASAEISERQEQAAGRLNEQFIHLGHSTKQLGLNLGELTGQWLGPASDGIAKFIDRLNASPEAMKAASIGLDVVLGAAVLRWIGPIARLTANLTGLTAALRLFGGLTGIGAFLEGMWPKTTNEGEDAALRAGTYARLYRHGAGVRINQRRRRTSGSSNSA
jgi:hypothetical protein